MEENQREALRRTALKLLGNGGSPTKNISNEIQTIAGQWENQRETSGVRDWKLPSNAGRPAGSIASGTLKMPGQQKQANGPIADETLKNAERWGKTSEKHREREPSRMRTNSGELTTPLLSYRRRAGLCGN